MGTALKDDGSRTTHDDTNVRALHKWHTWISPSVSQPGFSTCIRSQEVSSVIVRRPVSCGSLRCSRFWSRFIDHVLDRAPSSASASSLIRSSLSRLENISSSDSPTIVTAASCRFVDLITGHSREFQFSQSICRLGVDSLVPRSSRLDPTAARFRLVRFPRIATDSIVVLQEQNRPQVALRLHHHRLLGTHSWPAVNLRSAAAVNATLAVSVGQLPPGLILNVAFRLLSDDLNCALNCFVLVELPCTLFPVGLLIPLPSDVLLV